MSIIMSIGIKYFKRLLNKKGQGIVEFALLCSFCAAIALFARDAGFSEAFNESLDKSKPELYSAAIGMRPRNGYMYYFNQWSTMTSSQIREQVKDNNKRIEADQKALVKLAEAYLGKTENQVLDIMNLFSNSLNDSTPSYVGNLKIDGNNGTGFSKGVLVPLSYAQNTLNSNAGALEDADRRKGWLWLDSNNNQNTVSYLTDAQGKVYGKFDPDNPCYNDNFSNLKTVTTDRLFYSEEMLDANGRVTLRLHYTDGKVDFVDIALRTGNKGANDDPNNYNDIATGLCLHVVESGYSRIEIENMEAGANDIVNNPINYYNPDGTLKN